MPVLTENEIRRLIDRDAIGKDRELVVSKKDIITPSARTYLNEKNIHLKFKEETILKEGAISKENTNLKGEIEQVEADNNKFRTLFGATLNEKSEHMTHLRGNLLVFKDHPRIAFRGKIDSLESKILQVQLIGIKEKLPKLVEDLEEIIDFIRSLIRCEVSGEPVGEFILQGLSASELREQSHHPSKYFGISHFLPSYTMGEMVVELNGLRTLTREVELVAYKAFADEYGKVEREDIIKALNRLSSLFWIMMFKVLAHKY